MMVVWNVHHGIPIETTATEREREREREKERLETNKN